MSRKPAIKSNFARSVDSYEDHSALQAQVGKRLAELLPEREGAHVLELGCGTGVFTRHLFERYPRGHFYISDFSREMVGACERAVGKPADRTFAVIDADALMSDQQFDVVASSMVLHWLDDPLASLREQRKLLVSNGQVVFATLGQDNFPEWQETLAALGLGSGTITMAPLPGVVFEEQIAIDYGCARNFLASLKKTGAAMSRAGYRPLSSSALSRVCAAYDARFGGTVTWHIVYGVLGRLDP